MGIQVDSGARELVLLQPQYGIAVATTGNGSVPGGSVNVGAYSQLLVFLEIASLTGTLNVFLDSSSDGGATWYQYAQLGPVNIAAVPTLDATHPTYPSTWMVSCGLANTGNGSFGDTVRVRYTLTGAGAALSGFAVKAVGKPN